MSAYEDYTAVSADYDRTRVPIGVEIILGCLSVGGGDRASLRVLDAGCGTGSFAVALRTSVGAIDAVDMNPAMLRVARGKLDGTPGCPVALHEAGIDALPFEDASFDAVMVNQVLHHLPDAPQRGWPMHRRVLGELARVLRPGGAAIVNTCSHRQMHRGWWYASLVPAAVEAMCRRHADTTVLNRLLADAGLLPPRPIRAERRGDAGRRVLRRARPARSRMAPRRLAVVDGVGGGARACARANPRPRRSGNARRVRRRTGSREAVDRADRVSLRSSRVRSWSSEPQYGRQVTAHLHPSVIPAEAGFQ